MGLLLMFLVWFNESIRVQVYFYNEKKEPISLQYYWIDTTKPKKLYKETELKHQILQHQEFLVKSGKLRIYYQLENEGMTDVELTVNQPGKFNLIFKDAIYVKCKNNCVPFKATKYPDLTVFVEE